MRLDAHQHFWSLSNPFTQWPTSADGEIHRDFGPEELAGILSTNGIERTILVQASPNIEETRWCLEIAEKHAFVSGVVGWIDFEAADALAQLDSISGNPKLVGLRPLVQAIAQPGWLLQDQFRSIFLRMIDQRLCFDALVLNHQIGDVSDLASRYPTLPIVLDHAGKPPLQGGRFAEWAKDVARLAAHQTVLCKLSGLWTEAGPDHSLATIGPWVTHVLECFGPERLMWGSDWPVITSVGSYAEWHMQCLALIDHLGADNIDGVMGENGRRFYGI